jgi:hypothetical protein
MLRYWHSDPSDYKIEVGAAVVLNEILRNDENYASKLSETLTNDDIKLLVNALSDSNKTVRMQMTEFLYSLKDKRIVENSLDSIHDNANQNGVYNNVLILKEIIPSLNEPERVRVRNAVIRLVPSSYNNAHALAVTIDP